MSLISRWFQKPSPSPDAAVANVEPVLVTPGPAPVPEAEPLSAQEERTLAAALTAGDGETIGRLVMAGSSPGVRQRAAQAVEELPQLRELIRRLRGGNDKRAYRILTAKRDALLAQQRDAARVRAEAEAAVAALERHSRRPFDALFAPTLEQFEKRWQAVLDTAGPELSGRAAQALERAGETIRQHREALELQAESERAAAQAASEAGRRRELENQAAAAAASEQARLDEEARRAHLEMEQAEARSRHSLTGLLRGARAALEEGNTARAARLRGLFEAQRAAGPALPAWATRLLEQVDARLNELKDWKAFSVAPKRDELIHAIESLIGSTLEPVALARRVRDLRQQWRTLGKGAGEAVAVEWQQRFQDAAQRAYEPCQVYFAALAQQRRANLEHRAALIERLAAFWARHGEQQADWRLVNQVLGEARQEWRRHVPVERAAGASLQERFDALCSALRTGLEAEYARNVEARQALIARAAALLTSADIRTAIDEIKSLQRRWQGVGLVPREQDGALWEAFRKHCDAIFQRREQESAAYAAGLEANRIQALALCEELERCASLSGQELLAGQAQVKELRAAFEPLELPRQGGRELLQRFERGIERFQHACAAQRAHAAQRIWTDLLELADRLRALALGVGANADLAACGALQAQAAAAMAAVRHWPQGARSIVERQFEQARAGAGAAATAVHEAALRTLCVRAEILANVSSAPEDLSLRRAQQLQRLVQSMGQGLRTDASELETLMNEWLAVGPIEAATYTQLADRFARCFLALSARSAC